jgi:hypothetical protein
MAENTIPFFDEPSTESDVVGNENLTSSGGTGTTGAGKSVLSKLLTTHLDNELAKIITRRLKAKHGSGGTLAD